MKLSGLILICCLLIMPVACIKNSSRNISVNTDSLALVLQKSYEEQILNIWYPRMVDTVYGGYFTNADYAWNLAGEQPKVLVTQSRLLWTSAEAAIFTHDTIYLRYARSGFNFLKNKLWDKKFGGFYSIRTQEGSFMPELYGSRKMAYGNAFAIYALCSYYRASKDPEALQLAQNAFRWLEKHSHDSIHGGYVDALREDGHWLAGITSNGEINRIPGTFYKDYNSSIHILEGLTSLYSCWPDSLVQNRLREMLLLVRDRFVNPAGYLKLNFSCDWQFISNRDSSEEVIRRRKEEDHVSFGHDVETAYLMLEASRALHIEKDTVTLRVAKKLVDHALKNGFDWKHGGFYYEGYYFKNREPITILEPNGQWWTQAEGLNALLLMAKIFPGESTYRDAFLLQWQYIESFIIDKKKGGWFFIGMDRKPEIIHAAKATMWKANYHNSRAMMNCIRMLHNEDDISTYFKAFTRINATKP